MNLVDDVQELLIVCVLLTNTRETPNFNTITILDSNNLPKSLNKEDRYLQPVWPV